MPLLAGLVIACGSGGRGPAAVTVRDSAGITLTTITEDRDAAPAWALDAAAEVTIRRPGQAEFGRIRAAAWTASGAIIVLDDQVKRLDRFGPGGDYQGSFGGAGDGPGEFRQPWTLSTMGDTVYVYDFAHARVSVLHATHGYARDVRFDPTLAGRPQAVWAVAPDRLVAYFQTPAAHQGSAAPPRLYRWDGRIETFDLQGRPLDQRFTFDDGPTVDLGDGDGPAFFAPRPVIAVRGTRVAFAPGGTYRVTIFDPRWQPLARIQWPARTEPVRASEVDSVRAAFHRSYEKYGSPIADRLTSDLLRPDLLPDARPPIGGLLIDDAGRLWVADYPTPLIEGGAPIRWDVLSPEGRPVGRLETDSKVRLADVRGPLVLTIEADADGVPSVAVRRILGQPNRVSER